MLSILVLGFYVVGMGVAVIALIGAFMVACATVAALFGAGQGKRAVNASKVKREILKV